MEIRPEDDLENLVIALATACLRALPLYAHEGEGLRKLLQKVRARKDNPPES